MKKLLLLFTLILLLSPDYFAQYRRRNAEDKKYFAGTAYGVGTATWFSRIANSELYDNNGGVIRSGDMKFKLRNPTRVLNLEVSAPITRKVMLGMGIGFEEYYLDKLVLDIPEGGGHVIFDESFRFDKIYLQALFPLQKLRSQNFSVSIKNYIGFFGYTGVSHLNFFGQDQLSRSFLSGAGVLADYKAFPHVYIYINPIAEYKYFNNSKLEHPATINHNIFTFSILGGIRVDVSRD